MNGLVAKGVLDQIADYDRAAERMEPEEGVEVCWEGLRGLEYVFADRGTKVGGFSIDLRGEEVAENSLEQSLKFDRVVDEMRQRDAGVDVAGDIVREADDGRIVLHAQEGITGSADSLVLHSVLRLADPARAARHQRGERCHADLVTISGYLWGDVIPREELRIGANGARSPGCSLVLDPEGGIRVAHGYAHRAATGVRFQCWRRCRERLGVAPLVDQGGGGLVGASDRLAHRALAGVGACFGVGGKLSAEGAGLVQRSRT